MEELSILCQCDGDKMEMAGKGLCFVGSAEVRLSHTLEEGISFSRRNMKHAAKKKPSMQDNRCAINQAERYSVWDRDYRCSKYEVRYCLS